MSTILLTIQEAGAIDARLTALECAVDKVAAPSNLRAMGIDSASLRWAAVRDYQQELRDDSTRAVNRLWLIASFFDYATDNAIRRGEPDLEGWGPALVQRDFYEAHARAVAPYTGKARDAAATILNPFIPGTAR